MTSYIVITFNLGICMSSEFRNIFQIRRKKIKSKVKLSNLLSGDSFVWELHFPNKEASENDFFQKKTFAFQWESKFYLNIFILFYTAVYEDSPFCNATHYWTRRKNHCWKNLFHCRNSLHFILFYPVFFTLKLVGSRFAREVSLRISQWRQLQDQNRIEDNEEVE